jgi:hypothetical protein
MLEGAFLTRLRNSTAFFEGLAGADADIDAVSLYGMVNGTLLTYSL